MICYFISMKIHENLKELIAEGESVKTQYGCVMLYFEGTDELTELQDKISDDDVYSKLVDGKEDYGRTPKNEYHVTLLYGLHEEVSDETITEILHSEPTPDITVGEITLFENDFDVVKFDIESEGLNSLNKKMVKEPHTNDYPDYHPHTTIIYAKKGKGDKVIGDIGGKDTKVELVPSHFVYSKVDGTKLTIPFK